MSRPLAFAVVPLLAAAFAACTPPPVEATAPPPPEPTASATSTAAALPLWIDSYVSALGASWGDGYAFSGYLVVAHDGAVVFEKAYGKSDREKGLPAARSTRFRIGSLTKQLTAAAVLTLVERGALQLTDPLRKYVPEAPPSWAPITIHHLLTHTSGIASYTADAAFMAERDKPHTRAQVMSRFFDRPLVHEPGSRFAYSNSGYFLLGVVIERVSHQSYEAYLTDRVLRPAGMSHTSTVDAPTAPDTAVGYTINDQDEVERALTPDMSIPFAAGALRSTAEDLLAWDRALDGTSVLTAASRERMFTVDKDTYAYGVNRSTFVGHDVLSHTGGIDGFTSYLARALDDRWTVIALSNNDAFEAKKVGGAALEMALTGRPLTPPPELAPLAVDPPFAARVTGAYVLTEDSRRRLEEKVPKEILDSAAGMTISLEGDRLFMKPSGQPRVRVFRAADAVLFTKRDPLELHLDPSDASSRAVAVTLKQSGLEGRYERAPTPPR